MVDPRSIPTEDQLKVAGALKVLDSQSNEVLFSSLFEEHKTIVVFIRHFFCGRCQEYVQALANASQQKLDDGVEKRIVIIGCGEWESIKTYAQKTGFKGAIYADPTRSVYHALGMNIERLATTPANQKKRSHIHQHTVSNIFSSIGHALVNPGLIGKQGNISQLGGEFVMGPGYTCSFASRMQHTEDHVEIDELFQV